MKLLKIEKNVETTKNIVNLNMSGSETNSSDKIDKYYLFLDKNSLSHTIFNKQPLRDRKLADFITIDNESLQIKFSNSAIDEAGFNLFAIERKFKLKQNLNY